MQQKVNESQGRPPTEELGQFMLRCNSSHGATILQRPVFRICRRSRALNAHFKHTRATGRDAPGIANSRAYDVVGSPDRGTTPPMRGQPGHRYGLMSTVKSVSRAATACQSGITPTFRILNAAPMRTYRPLIGIPADRRMLGAHPFHAVGEKYISAVLDAAGALPLLIPAIARELELEELLEDIDGLLLTGSISNVEPRHYQGEASAPGTLHDAARDATTLPLINRAVEGSVPVLGICRGFQEMNVAYGGTLWQSLEEAPGLSGHHEYDDEPLDRQYGVRHEVNLVTGGQLQRLAGKDRLQVNSLHHQGIRKLAAALDVEATADDGLIEAVSVRDARAFALAVQWHPEWRVMDDPFSRALFENFGEAARRRAAARRQTGDL
jgi:putative glutamine amidotransferase